MWCCVCQKPVQLMEPMEAPAGKMKVRVKCHGAMQEYTFAMDYLRKLQAKGEDVNLLPAFSPSLLEPIRPPAKLSEKVRKPADRIGELLDKYHPGWGKAGRTVNNQMRVLTRALAAQRVMLQCASAVQMQNGVLRHVLSQLKEAGITNAYAEKVAEQLHAEFSTVPDGEIL